MFTPEQYSSGTIWGPYWGYLTRWLKLVGISGSAPSFIHTFLTKHGVDEILPLFCAQTGPPLPVSMKHTPQAYPCLCSDSEAWLKSQLHYKNATASRKSLAFYSVSKRWVRENLFSCPYFSFLLYPVKATVWAIYQDDFLWLVNKENAHTRCRKISQINRWEDFYIVSANTTACERVTASV